MRKVAVILLGIFLSIFLASANEKFTVVIDPGHGGKDGGAVRNSYKEKDINLGVAKALGQLIESNYKDVKVVYTRKTDVFIALDRRADIANKAQANLFISIHTNSTAAKSTSASGADTYILGVDRSDENMRVAQRENSVIELEDNYKQKYQDFDPKSPESYIIFEFMTNKYMDQSLDFAGKVQHHFRNTAKRADRGVRQAGFLVLRATACPSVLIELGFINNNEEAKFLSSASGQNTMATAIFQGFKAYKRDFDRRQGIAVVEPSNRKQDSVIVTAADTNETPKKENSVKTPKTETINNSKNTSTASGQVEYRVQIHTAPRNIALKASNFKGLSPINVYTEGSTYKYTYGSTTNYNEAQKLLKKAKLKYKDAFVIRFKDGKRITN